MKVVMRCEIHLLLHPKSTIFSVTAQEVSGADEIDLTKLYLARFASDENYRRVKPKRHRPNSKVRECTVAP